MDFELINVGIADLVITSSPNVLRTILGSCVGVCLYDSSEKIGGLSHIMLPASRKEPLNVKKYAVTAIPLLVDEMVKAGGKRQNFTAKLCGGATMFKHAETSLMGDIGKNNIKSVKEVLGSMNIKIIAEDLGGDYGRTIDFFIESGEVKIKSIGKDLKII